MTLGTDVFLNKKRMPKTSGILFLFCQSEDCQLLVLGSLTAAGFDIDSRISVSAWMFFIR